LSPSKVGAVEAGERRVKGVTLPAVGVRSALRDAERYGTPT
jgi:hypothetical protein